MARCPSPVWLDADRGGKPGPFGIMVEMIFGVSRDRGARGAAACRTRSWAARRGTRPGGGISPDGTPCDGEVVSVSLSSYTDTVALGSVGRVAGPQRLGVVPALVG